MVQNLPTKKLDERPKYSLKGESFLKINRIDPRLRILKVQKQDLIMRNKLLDLSLGQILFKAILKHFRNYSTTIN